MNHFYFMSLAIGGLVHRGDPVGDGRDVERSGSPNQRVFHGLSSDRARSAWSFLYFGLHHLYIWTDPDSCPR